MIATACSQSSPSNGEAAEVAVGECLVFAESEHLSKMRSESREVFGHLLPRL